MKKYLSYIILMVIIALLLVACQSDKPDTTITKVNNGNSGSQPLSDEVIETHGGLENIERLVNFVQNVQDQKKDKVTLTRHTIEGDPIYHKLNYDGEQIEFTIDNSKDKFGSGEILYYECGSINKHETNTETKYALENCSDPQIGELLTIFHDVNREDYFEFDLKYGVDKNNEINTKDQKLDLDAGNGNRVAVSDFQLSSEEMNDIYKLMLFSNYLQEKKLTNKCEAKETYELTVWINSGERHFDWADCDTSTDGIEMTQLVEDIVNVLKTSETYKSIK